MMKLPIALSFAILVLIGAVCGKTIADERRHAEIISAIEQGVWKK
jgi:hypothetical protein